MSDPDLTFPSTIATAVAALFTVPVTPPRDPVRDLITRLRLEPTAANIEAIKTWAQEYGL